MPQYFLRYSSILVNMHTRQNPQLVKAQRCFHSLFSAVVKHLHLVDNQKMGLKPCLLLLYLLSFLSKCLFSHVPPPIFQITLLFKVLIHI